jgi:hypothetical protein
MAIHRGIQSALFYYLSCAPCAEARYRKKRKQDAKQSRAERAVLELEMPHVYRHPLASSTNPHWDSEIAAGPVLAARGKKKTNTTRDGASNSRNGAKSSMTQRSNDSKTPSTTDLSLRMGSRDGRTDSKLHFQQFQRDDEPYSSASMERLASNSTLNSSTRSGLTRPSKAKLRPDEGYLQGRNPQVNDLHPATVTKVSSKEEMGWLMAPPPTADFMSGKDRSTRSRSDSGGSRLSSRSGVPLSREVSRRIIEQKRRNGEAPATPSLSRESTMQLSSDPTGQRHDRIDIDEKDFALRPASPQRSPNLPAQDSSESSDSAQTMIRRREMAPVPAQARRVASRPQLSTIASDSIISGKAGSEDRLAGLHLSKENIDHSSDSTGNRDRISHRSELVVTDDSLQTLQRLAPASSIWKQQAVPSARNAQTKLPRLPPQNTSEEKQLEGGPEMFDSWYTADFHLPEWIHEHTKREVTQRWSMDI